VEEDGDYAITLSRWPKEANLSQWDIPGDGGVELRFPTASIAVQGRSIASMVGNTEGPQFTLPLKKGPAVLEANFHDQEGRSWAAYYVYIRRLAVQPSSEVVL
jgi:hypothetical protein